MKCMLLKKALFICLMLSATSLTGWAQTNVFPTSGNVGIGTTSPGFSLDVRTPNEAGVITSFLSSSGITIGQTQRWTLRIGRAWDTANRSVDFGMVSSSFGNNPGFYVGIFGNERFRINSNGNVGIGTSSPTNKLEVNGTIKAKEVNITATGWPDYVFRPEYKLMSLGEVETFIRKNGYLPNIPSEAEVMEKGINVGEVNAKLLEKIEELTLYMIEQHREMESQKLIITEQSKNIALLLKQMEIYSVSE